MNEHIVPDWPAPPWVKALITTRVGGCSAAPYDSLNLADHVGDDPALVAQNRALLRCTAGLPEEPRWLRQVHGCTVASDDGPRERPCADAITTTEPGRVCAVLTADCLPLLICNRSGTRVAAVHAGWRGLAAGVIEACLQRFKDQPEDLLVWLGPAIGPGAFEVGSEVREAFVRQHTASEAAFEYRRPGHWLADLYALARIRLGAESLGFAGGGDRCTYTERDRFFSYRREGTTGRFASMVWLQPVPHRRR